MSINRTTTVEHADNVEHSDNTSDATSVHTAGTVDNATNVGTVEHQTVNVNDEPATSGVRKLRAIRDLSAILVVLIALLLTFTVVRDNRNKELDFSKQTLANRELIKTLQEQVNAANAVALDKTVCARRYQDVVDAANVATLTDIGDLVVIISTIVPGPDREAAVQGKIKELNQATIDSRKAVTDKFTYTNGGNVLPCPIGQTQVTP